MSKPIMVECPFCDGEGKYTDAVDDGGSPEFPCDYCGGTGAMKKSEIIEYNRHAVTKVSP